MNTMNLDFETKLSVITGSNFITTHDNRTICEKEKEDRYDQLLIGQAFPMVPCRVAVAADSPRVRYDIDNTAVNYSAFDRFYNWKTQDIIQGKITAHQMSQQIGVNLKDLNGLVIWADQETDDFYTKAERTNRIDEFLNAATDKGYDWRFVDNRLEESSPAAIVLVKKAQLS